VNSRILITGGAGFIGSHLCEKLLAEGREVVMVDNFNDYYDPDIKRRNIKEMLHNASFTLHEGDIRDADFIHGVFADVKPEAVIHLAAMAGVRPSIEEPVYYYDVNMIGTAILLEAAVKNPVENFVFGSSSSVYGFHEKVPFSEADPISTPASPYAATKLAGEQLCYTYQHLHGIPVNCLRFFTVYGPRQRPEMAIHKFARKILAGESIDLYGDGTSRRDYTYVDDIIHGVVQALDRPHPFEIFNLGESQTVELSYLVELIEEKTGVKAVRNAMPDQPGDVPITYADISKARQMLDYDPKVKIEEGVERFINWLSP
jgi:UDP-glucuronate 4-epimerase